MSSPAQFKFTKDGITRRVAFTQSPSWVEIATKLESLYSIAVEHVAVSYTDADGDEVTLSTQEELEDYYKAESDPSLRRLSVVDLSIIRSIEDKPLPDTPSISHRLRETPSHNTFGTVPFHQDTVEDDWQRIPGFNPFYTGDISSGSGGEVQFARIGGDSTIQSSLAKDAPANYSGVATPTPGVKGKGREYENTSSTASVLANETPEKPPVHVYQVPADTIPQSSDTIINIQEVPPSTATSAHDAPDPPLADLDSPAAGPPPTLTGDVAAFLGMISAMFAQNPQLIAALRSMMFNVGNGAYWAAHRDQLNRAAQEVRRSASNIQANFNPSETDAARQIAQAVGNIVRSFAQNAPPQEGGDSENVPGGWPNPFRPPPHGPFPPYHGHFPPPPPPPGSIPPGAPPHPGPFPPFPPLHAGFPFRGRGPFGRGGGRGGPFHWGPHGRHGHHGHEGPGPHRHRHRRPEDDSHSDSSGESADDAEADVSMYGVSQRVSPEARKAKLLAAKAEYKAQKSMYRAERQAKRIEKQKSNTTDVDVAEAAARVATINVDVNSSADPANPGDPLLISQGRGQFPSLEMVSVPRRHHTISGGTVRGSRHGRDASGSTNQTATVEVRRARVVRRLSDMGFGGPNVENRVSRHIPDDQTMEEKNEDAIVTDVVDELLESEGNGVNESPATPQEN